VWSAAIFLAIQATGNLSGEWLIGGVEAKGFAYGALLIAIAAGCRDSWIESGIAAGIAISFHPVVGVWGVIALAAAGAAGWASRTFHNLPDLRPHGYRRWRQCLLSAALCLLFSLPGLIPAAAVVAGRRTAEEARVADEIQVFYRLKHHLDPSRFSTDACWVYAGLFLGWLILRRLARFQPEERFFARFVLATAAFAAGGLVVGIWVRAPGLMKFYPFRLLDLFLPIAVSVTAASLLDRLAEAPLEHRRIFSVAAGHLLSCAVLAWSFFAPGRAANASRWPSEKWAAFVDACDWIQHQTPADAVFLTPRDNVGFKWYAQRAEYVTWKDCPQDVAGLLEWGKRVNRVGKITHRRPKSPDAHLLEAELAEFDRATGVHHVLSAGPPPGRIEPLYRNGTFSVYVIRPARE
jgi:hypothetical protein